MKLAALVDSPTHVCCRYRLRAFEPMLNNAGHEITYFADPRTLLGRFRISQQLQQFDVVILQRRLPPWWERRLLRRAAKTLIFDLDDAIWLRDSFSNKGTVSRKRSARFRKLARILDDITAGNQFLKDACLKHGAKQGEVIPTCVDFKCYQQSQHLNQSATLAWIGSSSTLQGIEAKRALWEQIGNSVPGLSLKVICDRFPKFDHLPVVEVPWSELSEREELASADIGISWIPDDLWSRGKCGLKVLQFMAAGLPVVANPVGVHPEMIEHGVNGFLAETDEEWITAIQTLAANPVLRKKMGQKAFQVVQERYSVEFGASRWLQLLESHR